MNKDQIQGKWEQLKGKIKERWGKLTNDDLDVLEGKREVLAGKIQEAYGLAKEDVEKQLAELEKSCECDSAATGGPRLTSTRR